MSGSPGQTAAQRREAVDWALILVSSWGGFAVGGLIAGWWLAPVGLVGLFLVSMWFTAP